MHGETNIKFIYFIKSSSSFQLVPNGMKHTNYEM
jgi:hypothetical protein